MPDWEEQMKQAKEDVLLALDIWATVLKDVFGPRLEYAYAKGSAVKQWRTLVDYVPIISDLDIHIKMTDSNPLFPETYDGFFASINVCEEFEERFVSAKSEFLHIPRIQIVHLNPNLNDPMFILPQVGDVHAMVGSPDDAKLPKLEDVRRGDRKEMLGLEEYLGDLPRQAFDRVGLDFWQMLRGMNWRVSPAPIRLLTQNHPSPLYVWKWNRTRIVKELRANGYESIADSYKNFYETGWRLFLSKFTNHSDFRKIVVHGYNVLHGCLEEIKNLGHNQRV
ncbi:MAG: hypothetical protein ACFFE2_08900 [Candidatus Thorarchaeota archaeon]